MLLVVAVAYSLVGIWIQRRMTLPELTRQERAGEIATVALALATTVAVWRLLCAPVVRRGERPSDEGGRLGAEVNQMRVQLEEAHTRLQAHAARTAAFLQSAGVGAALLNSDARFTEVNARLADFLAVEGDGLRGRTMIDVAHEDDRELLAGLFGRLRGSEAASVRGEHRYVRHDGGSLWLDVSLSAIRDEEGCPLGFAVVCADITVRKRLEQELFDLSRRDALTGMADRRAFEERLEAEWRRWIRLGQPVSLIRVDTDWFKLFNDTYGRDAGDDCLRHVAAGLMESFRRVVDFAARWDGEEFAVILAPTMSTDAITCAERFRLWVHSHPIARPGQNPDLVTVSIGVATGYPALGGSAKALILSADAALYAAKSAGRDRVAYVRAIPLGDEEPKVRVRRT